MTRIPVEDVPHRYRYASVKGYILAPRPKKWAAGVKYSVPRGRGQA